jgi:hypothetical protein
MSRQGQTQLRVIDAFEHPHGGRILRLRWVDGAVPTLRDLKGKTLQATGPRGEEGRARILGFPLMGGHPSDARIRESGRVDVFVDAAPSDGPQIGLRWSVVLNPR